MQIQKVQSNQQTFGTKVIIDPVAARQISLAGARRKVLSHIKALENNGEKDTLILSYANGYMLRAAVIEQNGNGCFINQTYKLGIIKEKQENGKNKYINLKKLYKEAKENTTQVIIDRRGFGKFIPYLGKE